MPAPVTPEEGCICDGKGGTSMNRRLLLCALLALPATAAADEAPANGRLTLTVRETAGIHRFGYPVGVEVPLGRPVREADRFRLLKDGRPIAAQFRPIAGGREPASAVYIDFIISPGPLEKQTYVVEYGPEVTPGPEPKRGMKVEMDKETITVAHPGNLAFVMPRHLVGLLRQVRAGEVEYLKSGSPGLLLRTRDRVEVRAGGVGAVPAVAKVTRSGPLAVGLRFESNEALGGGRQVTSVVDMEFPISKSWVRVTWTLADPKDDVAELGAELRLNVSAAPILVDFGAGSYVYATLRKNESAMLRAGRLDAAKTDRPIWDTLLGPAGKMSSYVVAAPGERRPAEGWAHVMDKQRCTAVAVEGFAEMGQEAELTIDAEGRLRIWRSLAPGGKAEARKPKRLSFWLHFVDMPVHIGAATSPQAMLAPLRVEVGR
jgi:hypothetical protein